MKGLPVCKASERNIRRIRVKDIIKEAEDYLKTYLSAGMDISDTKIAALRLKFNAFKSLECEKVNGTFTRLKCLLNDLENNGVTIPQVKVNATFVNSLPRKWLSMNQTQRTNNSIKNDNLATLCGKYNYEESLIDQIYKSETQRFTIQASSSKALISNHQFQDSDLDVEENQRTNNEFMADLNAEYHERALLANQKRFYKRSGRDDEYVSSDDEGSTKIKTFMAIAEDEPLVGKADARSGQWVDITMKKDEIIDLKKVTEKWTCSKVTIDQLLSKQVPGNIVKALSGKGRRKKKISFKEEPFPPLLTLIGATSFSTSESHISLSDLTLNMVDLTLETHVPKKTRPSVKVLLAYVIKKKTKKSPVIPKPCSDKKADSSTEQNFLILME
nr:hypothetical protein [Tanacetum cinerariifolium]